MSRGSTHQAPYISAISLITCKSRFNLPEESDFENNIQLHARWIERLYYILYITISHSAWEIQDKGAVAKAGQRFIVDHQHLAVPPHSFQVKEIPVLHPCLQLLLVG